nr:MAG TPA: hypothetical protein [Caudoviricetes sp.]
MIKPFVEVFRLVEARGIEPLIFRQRISCQVVFLHK